MKRADPKKQSLIYADGYSYTEIFQLSDLPEIPGGNQPVRVFYPSPYDERDIPGPEQDPALPPVPGQTV